MAKVDHPNAHIAWGGRLVNLAYTIIAPPPPLFLQKLLPPQNLPIWFVDLSETGSWTYRKPVCGPNGNRFAVLKIS